MPLPSTTFTFDVWRQTLAGTPSLGKVIGDFNYSWLLDGVAQVIVPVVTEGATSGNWRAYKWVLTMPATTGTFQALITSLSGTDAIYGGQITLDLQAYNETSLAGLILSSQGIPGIRTIDALDLGQVKSGDSYASGTLTVPLGKLTPFGFTDLTGLTISVEARTGPGTPAASVALTGTVVSIPGLTFNFKWDTMPAGMVLTTETSVVWTIDVQFKETASPNRIITTNSYFIAVVWDANDTV